MNFNETLIIKITITTVTNIVLFFIRNKYTEKEIKELLKINNKKLDK